MSWFEESRLDDPTALGAIDLRLRTLAESGARVRREAGAAAGSLGPAVERVGGPRPRAVVAAGPDSRLLRAVLEPSCPVPFVAWPHAGLPGWTGSTDLVVVLAPGGQDAGTASAVAEARRRGTPLAVSCPPGSLVAVHAEGRHTALLPATTDDPLAGAVVMLGLLHRLGLGPESGTESVADALDEVAVACSPHRDIAVNPAKMLALALADATPLVWGGSVLAARAARRVADSLRRTTGRTCLAGDAELLLPVIEAARPRGVFDDPFADDTEEPRPALLVLDDGAEDDLATAERARLVAAADGRGLRVDVVTAGGGGAVAGYASLLLTGTYAAEYLRLGLTDG